MADSKAATDSIAASVENGFDPPDVPSTSVSTEKKDGEGDVSGISKKDAEEKSVEEVKGVVVEGNGVEDLKDVEKVKDVENEKSVEIIDNVDEKKDLGSTKDDKDKRDVDDIKELVESEHGEKKEDARVTKAANEIKGVGEIVYREGDDDVNDAKDGEEKKDAGEASEIEVKSDVVELLEGQEDAKEANEDDKNKEAVKAFDEEEQKGFGETKDEERKKLDGETKHEEHKIALEERMDAEENDPAMATEDIGGKNNLQASGNVKDNSEKNYLGDIKGSEQIQLVDGEVHKVDNFAEQLKYGKNKQIGPGIKDDEQKRDLGGENDLKNNLKPVAGDERLKVKKRPKDIEKVEAEVGKKKVVDEKDEETVAIRGLTDEKDIAKEVHISEEEDAAAEEDDDGDIEKINSSKKVAKSSKRKRSREQRSANKGEVKDKSRAKGKKESGKKTGLTGSTIDAVSSPIGSSRERPVRERKTVERLVEVIEKEPNKAVIIEKGRGTPLKDIPNVAYKLARKKPADLKFLHQTLFGRRGKVVDFKSNILQFSGFAWHEAEEKQRAKIKEKLDKCIKDNLLDLCDLFDLSVSKTNTKKEEIIVKLVDFLEAPHATTDVILADREQSEKSRKRKQFSEGSGSRSSGGTPAKRSRKRSAKAESTPKSSDKNPPNTEDDEEENTENGVPHADDAPGHSESDVKENELSGSSNDEGETDDNDELGKGKNDKEQSPKNQGSAIVEKRRTGSNNKQVSSETQAKSPVKPPPSYKQSKAKKNDTVEKVFTRKKKKGSESPEASDDEVENEDVDELGKSPKNHGSSISKKRKRPGSNSKKSASQTVVKSPVKTAPSSYKPAKVEEDAAAEKVFTRKKKDSDSTKKSNSKSSVKDNSSGKRSGKGKATGEERKSAPTKADLRKTICEILKEVDFNTATFTDILKNLATHYKMDLTPKKSAIKQMIQEELTKLADEAEDSEDGEKEEIEKEENPKPVSKKVKA